MRSSSFGSALALFSKALGISILSLGTLLPIKGLAQMPPSPAWYTYGSNDAHYKMDFDKYNSDLQQQQLQEQQRTWHSPSNAPPAVQYSYKDYMKAGYEAEKAKDYYSALMYFNDALTLKPGDVYATRAINKVTPYEQAEEQKREAEEQKRQVENKPYSERLEDDMHRSSCTSFKEGFGRSEKKFYLTFPDCAKYFPGNHDFSQPNSSPGEIMQRVSQMSSREIYEAYTNHEVMKNLQESLCPISDPGDNEPHGCTWNVKDSVEEEFTRSRQKSGSSAPFNPNFDVKNYDPLAQ